MRPFKHNDVYVRCEARREAWVPKSHESVLLRQRQVSNKVNFLLICMSECSEDMCLVKNGSNMYLADDGVKELVIICDHIHFSHKNEIGLTTASCLLKGRSQGETHVTPIQEMNGHYSGGSCVKIDYL